jgi:hypothetical protein
MALENFYGVLCLVSGPDQPEYKEYPDLHLNLWEHDGDDVSLDIGLLINKNFPYPDIFFYLPWTSKSDQVIDLTPRISSANAIAAIFNESWTVTQNPRFSSITVEDPTTRKVLFQVVSPASYLNVESLGQRSHRLRLEIGRLLRTERLDPNTEKLYLASPRYSGHFR